MIQTSRTLIESADGVYSKLTQAQRAGIFEQTHTVHILALRLTVQAQQCLIIYSTSQ